MEMAAEIDDHAFRPQPPPKRTDHDSDPIGGAFSSNVNETPLQQASMDHG